MRTSSIITSLSLALVHFLGTTSATPVTLCSRQNTGSDNNPSVNNYQSNGACTTSCAGYAFGIVQYDKCWCSNVAPGSTVSLGQCNQDCPGFPDDKCGNEDSGVFGYIVLTVAPQGTADGGSTPQPTSAQQSQKPPSNSQPDTVTSLATVVQVSSAVSVSVASVTIKPSPTTTSSPNTPSPSVITIGGNIQTVVVTPTSPPQTTATVVTSNVNGDQPAEKSDGGFFSKTGAVAGTFVAVGVVVLALLGGLFWFCWRRRVGEKAGSERLNSFEEERGSRPPTFMSRRTSELGMKTDLGGAATRGNSGEKTPTSTHLTAGSMSRRTSIPLTDSRLNAAAMFHDNGSHMSVASLQDNHDYTRRVLQVANPDRPGSSAIEDD